MVVKYVVINVVIFIVDKLMCIVGVKSLLEKNLFYCYYLNVRVGLYNLLMDDVILFMLVDVVFWL